MDCTLILYAARKTALCERTLAKNLQPMGLRIRDTVFSTDAKALGSRLQQAFVRDDLCFVIGGMSFSDNREVRTILASAAASSHPELVRRLKTLPARKDCCCAAADSTLSCFPTNRKRSPKCSKTHLVRT